MIVKGTEHRRALEFMKLGKFLVSFRSSAAVGNVQASQRPDAINAVGISLRLVVGGLQIAPRFHLLAEVLEVVAGFERRGNQLAGSVAKSHFAVIESQAAIRFNDGHKERRKISEGVDLFAKPLNGVFEPFESTLRNRQSLGDS